MAEAARSVTELDDAYVARLLPVRDPRGHKGTNGKLLAVCGSLDYLGAALLVARAAARAGAGLVSLAVPASLQPLAAGRVPEATTHGLPETEVEGEVDVELALEWILDFEHDALAVGPGLRPGLATAELVEALLDGGASLADRQTSEPPDAADRLPPALLDAEALNSLATLPGWSDRLRRPVIVTPHPGEFRRLAAAEEPADDEGGPDLSADDDARLGAAADAAGRWRTIVVLKGARTVIAAPDGRICRAPFENPALATGGTGDVLTGVIGSLLAQGADPFDAACLGVYLHGVAGEGVRERIGDAGLLASDLPDEVARARRRLAAIREAGDRRFGFRVASDG